MERYVTTDSSAARELTADDLESVPGGVNCHRHPDRSYQMSTSRALNLPSQARSSRPSKQLRPFSGGVEQTMRDQSELAPCVAELTVEELEAVSGSEADAATLMQALSNCLRMISDMNKHIANIR